MIVVIRFHTPHMVNCNHYRSEIIVYVDAQPDLSARWLKYIDVIA